jgi:Ser/Thr protein kinase RdoA (MazF antagonist)
MCIEESKEDEAKEHHFVEAQIVYNDAREDNVVVQEEHLFTKV